LALMLIKPALLSYAATFTLYPMPGPAGQTCQTPEVTESQVQCNYSAPEGLASKLNSNAKRAKMQIAPEIAFEGSDSSDAARAQILNEIERLESHNQRITGCRVKVIAPSHKHRHGIGFQVHIWLTVPPHENIVVNHTGTDDARNEHAQVAIKDAFAAARRQVDALAA
jgi:ribosome-associated translation inhibitor RaiA